MKFDKSEAKLVADKCFERHNIGGNKRGGEEHVAEKLLRGEMALSDLAELFITVYRAFHPKLITES